VVGDACNAQAMLKVYRIHNRGLGTQPEQRVADVRGTY